MKVLFSYGTYNNRPYKACGVYESDNRENDGVITDYLSTIPDSYTDMNYQEIIDTKDAY